ncbi:MAG: SPFH domain-containing protein [Eubacteriales bacterium]|nr:SPFH domain-containing protein [Eubacteriales bacterium]
MGLIRAGAESVRGLFADQWREYFYCEAMDADVLVEKGSSRRGLRGSNKKGSGNIISDGSVIAVNEGQCMLIVDQGQVVEVCDEPGEFVYDASAEPSLFYGDMDESVERSFETLGRRFSFGGDAGRDQRVYFVNIREIPGNKYGTPNPIPYRVVDSRIGLDLEIAVRCHGEYSFRIVDPILFYTNVSGNVEEAFRREELEGQMRSELLTAMQAAFAQISAQGVRYYQLPGYTSQLAQALNAELSGQWEKTRGIRIVSFGISGVKAPEEDEKRIKDLQTAAALRDPAMAAATLAGAQADAMRAAASNTAAGPMMAFAGMNMAGAAGGMNAQELYRMAGQAGAFGQPGAAVQPGTAAQQAPSGWVCVCGAHNTGKFCSECGKPRPQAASAEWICRCGAHNTGKFCSECGSPRPEAGK